MRERAQKQTCLHGHLIYNKLGMPKKEKDHLFNCARKLAMPMGKHNKTKQKL